MPQRLTIEYSIPALGVHPSRGSVIEFLGWFPNGEVQGIRFEKEGVRLLIYFDENCLTYFGQREAEDLSRHVNVGVDRVLVRVSTIIERDDLVEYIRNTDPAKAPEDSALGKDYAQLGNELRQIVVDALGRLVSYVRTEKRQYWVANFCELKAGDNYTAKACFEDGKWFRWQPSNIISLMAVAPSKADSISQDDWIDAQKAVANEHYRAWPVGQLLADAFLLRDAGHLRASLVEACAALEVAIDHFLKSPNTEGLVNPKRSAAVNIPGLLDKAQSIGLRGTVNLLISMIFPAAIVSNELIVNVQNAVIARNEVVHKGRRRLKEKEVSKYIWSIRELCKTLREFTASR